MDLDPPDKRRSGKNTKPSSRPQSHNIPNIPSDSFPFTVGSAIHSKKSKALISHTNLANSSFPRFSFKSLEREPLDPYSQLTMFRQTKSRSPTPDEADESEDSIMNANIPVSDLRAAGYLGFGLKKILGFGNSNKSGITPYELSFAETAGGNESGGAPSPQNTTGNTVEGTPPGPSGEPLGETPPGPSGEPLGETPPGPSGGPPAETPPGPSGEPSGGTLPGGTPSGGIPPGGSSGESSGEPSGGGGSSNSANEILRVNNMFQQGQNLPTGNQTGNNLDNYNNNERVGVSTTLQNNEGAVDNITTAVDQYDEGTLRISLFGNPPDARIVSSRHKLWVSRNDSTGTHFIRRDQRGGCPECIREIQSSSEAFQAARETAGRFRLCPHWRQIGSDGYYDVNSAFGGSQDCQYCGVPRATQGTNHLDNCPFRIVPNTGNPDDWSRNLSDYDPDYMILTTNPGFYDGVPAMDQLGVDDLYPPGMVLPICDPVDLSSSDSDVDDNEIYGVQKPRRRRPAPDDDTPTFQPRKPSPELAKHKEVRWGEGIKSPPPRAKSIKGPVEGPAGMPPVPVYKPVRYTTWVSMPACSLRPLTTKDQALNNEHYIQVNDHVKERSFIAEAPRIKRHVVGSVRGINPVPKTNQQRITDMANIIQSNKLPRPFWEPNTYIPLSNTDFSGDKDYGQRLPSGVLNNETTVRTNLDQPDPPSDLSTNYGGPTRILQIGNESWFRSVFAGDQETYSKWRTTDTTTFSDLQTKAPMNTTAAPHRTDFYTEDTLAGVNWYGDTGTMITEAKRISDALSASLTVKFKSPDETDKEKGDRAAITHYFKMREDRWKKVDEVRKKITSCNPSVPEEQTILKGLLKTLDDLNGSAEVKKGGSPSSQSPPDDNMKEQCTKEARIRALRMQLEVEQWRKEADEKAERLRKEREQAERRQKEVEATGKELTKEEKRKTADEATQRLNDAKALLKLLEADAREAERVAKEAESRSGTPETRIEEPRIEEPSIEEPRTEEPRVEEPGRKETGTEEPSTEKTGTEKTGTEKTGTEKTGGEETGETSSKKTPPVSPKPKKTVFKKPDVDLSGCGSSLDIGTAVAPYMQELRPVKASRAGSKRNDKYYCKHCNKVTHTLGAQRRAQHFYKCWQDWIGDQVADDDRGDPGSTPPDDAGGEARGPAPQGNGLRAARKSPSTPDMSLKRKRWEIDNGYATDTDEEEEREAFLKVKETKYSEPPEDEIDDDIGAGRDVSTAFTISTEKDKGLFKGKTPAKKTPARKILAEGKTPEKTPATRRRKKEYKTPEFLSSSASPQVPAIQETALSPLAEERANTPQSVGIFGRSSPVLASTSPQKSNHSQQQKEDPETSSTRSPTPIEDSQSSSESENEEAIPSKSPSPSSGALSEDVTPSALSSPSPRKRKHSSSPVLDETQSTISPIAPTLPEKNLISQHKSKAATKPFVPRTVTKTSKMTELISSSITDYTAEDGTNVTHERREYRRKLTKNTEKCFVEIIVHIQEGEGFQGQYSVYRFDKGTEPPFEPERKKRKTEEEDIEEAEDKVEEQATEGQVQKPEEEAEKPEEQNREEFLPSNRGRGSARSRTPATITVPTSVPTRRSKRIREQTMEPSSPTEKAKTKKKVRIQTPGTEEKRKAQTYRKTPRAKR